MIINERKSTIYLPTGSEEHRAIFSNYFPFEKKEIGMVSNTWDMPLSPINMALLTGPG
jgi:hypothetical protein